MKRITTIFWFRFFAVIDVLFSSHFELFTYKKGRITNQTFFDKAEIKEAYKSKFKTNFPQLYFLLFAFLVSGAVLFFMFYNADKRHEAFEKAYQHTKCHTQIYGNIIQLYSDILSEKK